MKSLRCSLAMVVLGLSSILARADVSDFKFEILDPPTGGPYLGYINGASPISITFGVCPSASVNPEAAGADGCFTAFNNTNTTFSSFLVSFDNYSQTGPKTDFFNYLNSQPANCDTSPSTTAFTAATCGLNRDSSRYDLLFSGGAGFTPGEYIILAEFGASQFAFQNATASAIATTPEPGSVWLLGSGAALMALLVVAERRGFAFGPSL